MTTPVLTHAGFSGSMEVSYADKCLHGKVLFIDDLITYEAETPGELNDAFVEAVDRYLAYCERTGKPANKPLGEPFNLGTVSEVHHDACKAASEND